MTLAFRAIFAISLASLAGAGCAGGQRAAPSAESADPPRSPAAVTKVAPITSTDLCASQMHDICGQLLLYFARYDDLPEALAELNDVGLTQQSDAFVCPVSERPYIYTPNGLFIPERGARVVLYDPAPSHSGMRWAISVDEPQAGQPLVAKVIALPESFFLLRPPE